MNRVNRNPGHVLSPAAPAPSWRPPALRAGQRGPVAPVTRRPPLLIGLAAVFLVSTYLGAIHISDFPLAENPENVAGVLLATTFALTRLLQARLWAGPAKFFWVYLGVTALLEVGRYLLDPQGAASSLRAYAQFAQAILVYLIFYDLARDRRAVKVLAATFLGCTILLSFMAHLGLGVGAVAVGRGVAAERVGVLGMNLNYQGLLYAAAITGLLCHGIARWPRFGWKDWLLVLAGASMLLALLRTGSRGGLLTLVVGVGVALLLMFRGRRWAAYLLLVPLLLYGIGHAVMSSEVIRVRLFEETFERGQLGARDVLAQEAFAMFRERPLTGWGSAYSDELGARLGRQRIAAHNTYLQVATGFGVPGLVPWLLGLGATVWRLWRHRSDFWATVLLAVLAALLVAMIPGNYAYNRFTWLFLAVAGAIPFQASVPRSMAKSGRRNPPVPAFGRAPVYGTARRP